MGETFEQCVVNVRKIGTIIKLDDNPLNELQ